MKKETSVSTLSSPFLAQTFPPPSLLPYSSSHHTINSEHASLALKDLPNAQFSFQVQRICGSPFIVRVGPFHRFSCDALCPGTARAQVAPLDEHRHMFSCLFDALHSVYHVPISAVKYGAGLGWQIPGIYNGPGFHLPVFCLVNIFSAWLARTKSRISYSVGFSSGFFLVVLEEFHLQF
jgi:hypothetical protein